MGCGGSTGAKEARSGDGQTTPPDRRPKISIRIGPEVNKKVGKGPRLIFVFGGPGSMKGRVVDDLMTSYSFELLCVEQIIMDELTKKLSNIMVLEDTKQIKAAIEEDSSRVHITWVMDRLTSLLEQADHSATYLVDVIPNLKVILKCPSFVADVTAALQNLEKLYPVSFALNLAIPADKVLAAKQALCASPGGEAMKDSGGKGDEADTGRIQRRASLYESCSKPFLDYFRASDRLVTVDVTCGVSDLIWGKVHEILCDLDYIPKRTVNTLLLFALSEADVRDVKTGHYYMDTIHLKNIVQNENDSIEKLVSSLSKHIDTQTRPADAFVVMLDGTSIHTDSEQVSTNKAIIYTDVTEGQLESYLPGFPKKAVPKNSAKYTVLCSLENEVCLYPKHMDLSICKTITNLLARNRTIR